MIKKFTGVYRKKGSGSITLAYQGYGWHCSFGFKKIPDAILTKTSWTLDHRNTVRLKSFLCPLELLMNKE